MHRCGRQIVNTCKNVRQLPVQSTSSTVLISGNLSLIAACTPMPMGCGPSNFTVQTPCSTDRTCMGSQRIKEYFTVLNCFCTWSRAGSAADMTLLKYHAATEYVYCISRDPGKKQEDKAASASVTILSCHGCCSSKAVETSTGQARQKNQDALPSVTVLSCH